MYPDSDYPGGIDSFPDPDVTLDGTPLHSELHLSHNDAIEHIETELGVNPAGVHANVATRLDSRLPESSAPWVPTWVNLAVGNGTVSARFIRLGPLVYFYVQLIFGSTTGVTGAIQLGVGALPAILSPSNQQPTASVTMVDASAAQEFAGALDVAGASAFNVRYMRIDAAAANQPIREAGAATNTPFTWATNDRLEIRGLYLAA